MTRRPWTMLLMVLVAAATLLGAGCGGEPSDEDMAAARSARVRAYINFTGTRSQNGLDPEVDNMLVQMIDRARSTIDVATMGFSRREVIDAIVRAYLERGVRVRFVGDARHMASGTTGYLELDRYNIPMISGNQYHIMHNKFFVIDGRWVVTGTGNMTTTGFEKNDNNYVIFDSPDVAADFTAEFEQMFAGRFGYAKRVLDNGRVYEIGDTTLELYFSPQEDAMGRLLQGIEEATESIYVMIFAFTRDQVGSALVAKHIEFSRYNRCCDPAQAAAREADAALEAECAAYVICETPYRPKEVRAAIDRSQLHSNGPYHELYRLALFGVPMRLDGNDNSFLPGDYQAGGGRLHSKTMVIDAGTPTARVLTGSFNWSSSATVANDETFLVLRGERITGEYVPYFESLWDKAKSIGEDYVGDGSGVVEPGGCAGPDGAFTPLTYPPQPCPAGAAFVPGSVVFNEIHWDGYNGQQDDSDFAGDLVYNDEFIELLNTTDQPIDLSFWVIGTESDFTLGFYPGTVIGPHERFLILDHNLQPFVETEPQDQPHAFTNADFVMNGANDQRFLRLNLRNADFTLRLVDPRGHVIDVAGDGGPPFAGGRVTQSPPASDCGPDGDAACPTLRNYSMERLHPIGPGQEAASWQRPLLPRGGANVNEAFRDLIIASPGEPNSAGEAYPAEDADFRADAP